jgi:hypothetical protein
LRRLVFRTWLGAVFPAVGRAKWLLPSAGFRLKMQFKELSLFVPTIEAGTILKALETAIPASAVEQALKDTKAIEDRKRALPSHLVVCLIIAMSLWSKTSMRGVLKNLVDGLSEARDSKLARIGKYIYPSFLV